MGIRCTFMCDRCGLKEETIHKDNYFGTIKQYDAETYLCQKCRDGLNKAIRDYIHGTGPVVDIRKEKKEAYDAGYAAGMADGRGD